MKIYQKIMISVLAVCTLAAAVLGVFVRKSYNDTKVTPEESLSYLASPIAVPTEDTVEDTIETYLSNAKLVAKVRFTGEREERLNSMLSTVEVLEVYFGDTAYAGETVRIYEQFRLDSISRAVQSIGCFLPMQQGREYYAFLQPKDYIDVYQETLPYEEFRIYSGQFGGCFAAENKALPILPEDAALTWEDVADYDFIYHSKAEFDSCMAQKNAVLAYFEIPYTFPTYDELSEN